MSENPPSDKLAGGFSIASICILESMMSGQNVSVSSLLRLPAVTGTLHPCRSRLFIRRYFSFSGEAALRRLLTGCR